MKKLIVACLIGLAITLGYFGIAHADNGPHGGLTRRPRIPVRAAIALTPGQKRSC